MGRQKNHEIVSRGCTWLLGAMSLFTACPSAALGQESLPELPAMLSGPASVTQTEMDNPAEKSVILTEKRRFLGRLGTQPVTPEQREEAERLRQLNAKYGTDPTAIVGRIQLSSQYRNLPRSASSILTVARVSICRSSETTCSAWRRRSCNRAFRVGSAPPPRMVSVTSVSRSGGVAITRPNMPF